MQPIQFRSKDAIKRHYIHRLHFMNRTKKSNISLIGPYNGTNGKTEFLCHKCGSHFKSRAGDLLRRKHPCRTCQFLKKLYIANNKYHRNLQLVGKYRGSSHINTFRDARTKELIRITAKNAISSHKELMGCALNVRCRKFILRLKNANLKKHEHIMLYGKYQATDVKTCFKCCKCGLLFYSTPRMLLKSIYMCPYESLIHGENFCLTDNPKLKTYLIYKYVYDETKGEYRVLAPQCITSVSTKELLMEHHATQCPFYQRYHYYYKFYIYFDSFRSGQRCPIDSMYHKKQAESVSFNTVVHRIHKLTSGQYVVRSNGKHYHSERSTLLIEHRSNTCPYYIKYHKYPTFHMTAASFLHSHSRCPYDARYKISKANCHSLSQARHIVAQCIDSQHYRLLQYAGNDNRAESLFEHHSKKCLFYRRHHKYYKFRMLFRVFTSGARCPYEHMYRGELAIMYYLHRYGLKLNKDYLHSYVYSIHPFTRRCQHADVFLPNFTYNAYYVRGVDIEFDGVQHFSYVNWSGKDSLNKQHYRLIYNHYNDKVKDMYCKEHHIKMIRIKNIYNYQTMSHIVRLVTQTLDTQLKPALIKYKRR